MSDESLTLVWAFHHQYPCPWTPVYPGSCAYTCRDVTQPQNVAYICTHIRIIRLHVCIHTNQLCTRCTEGVLRRLSGNKSISFIIFASLTGSSCLRNVNDVFAHAFSEPAKTNVQRQKTMTSSSSFGACIDSIQHYTDTLVYTDTIVCLYL